MLLNCAPSRTRTCGLLLRRHSPNVAWHRPVWPDVGSTSSESGWMWPDVALCLWSLAPVWLPGISLAALTLGISAAHASPMHDPSQQLSSGQSGQGNGFTGYYFRDGIGAPDGPSHHRDRISWCRRLQQPASLWRSPVPPSRVMDSAGERSHARTGSRSRRPRPRCRHPGRSRDLRSLSVTQHADNARSCR